MDADLHRALRSAHDRRALSSLARELTENFAREFDGIAPKTDSVAVKLSLAARNKAQGLSWIKSHPKVTRALRQLLELEAAEPVPNPRAERLAPSPLFVGPSFLPHPRVDLRESHVAEIFDWALLEPAAGCACWVTLTRGVGATTAAQVARHRRGIAAVDVTSLAELGRGFEGLPSGPLLAVVDDVSADHDQVLERLRARSSVVLLAPGSPSQEGWQRIPWRYARGWRSELACWLVAQLGEEAGARFRQELWPLIERFDPAHRKLTTVAALLECVALFRARGAKKVSKAIEDHTLVDHWLEQRLEEVDPSPRKRTQVRRRVEGLVEERLRPPVRPPPEDRFRAAARSALGDRERGTNETKIVAWAFEALAVRVIRAWVERDQPSWRSAALRPDQQRYVDAALDQCEAPSFVSVLTRRIAETTPGRESPSDVAALEALFSATARRLQRQGGRGTLPRSLLLKLRDRQLALSARLASLNELSLPGHTGARSTVFETVTRALPCSTLADGNAGLADCWAWSLLSGLPAPEVSLCGAQFPGWFTPSSWELLAGVERLTMLPGSEVDAERNEPTEGWARLLAMGEKFWAQISPERLQRAATKRTPHEGGLAAVLLPSLVVRATHRAVLPTLDLLHQGLRYRGVWTSVLRALSAAPPAALEAGVRWLFDAQLSGWQAPHQGADAWSFAFLLAEQLQEAPESRPLFDLLARHVPQEALREAFASLPIAQRDWEKLQLLPAAFRQAFLAQRESALRSLSSGASAQATRAAFSDLEHLLTLDQRFEAIPVKWLASMLKSTGHEHARGARHALVNALWKRAPARAVDHLRAHLTSPESASLVGLAPHSEQQAVLRLLEDTAEAMPAWCDRWLRATQRACPELSERALALLLRRHPAAPAKGTGAGHPS